MSSILKRRPDHPSDAYAGVAAVLVLAVAVAAIFAIVAAVG